MRTVQFNFSGKDKLFSRIQESIQSGKYSHDKFSLFKNSAGFYETIADATYIWEIYNSPPKYNLTKLPAWLRPLGRKTIHFLWKLSRVINKNRYNAFYLCLYSQKEQNK